MWTGIVNFALDLTPLWLTLQVAGVATLVTFIVGVNLAFLVARSRFWGREGLDALCTLPLVMPPTVLGYYLIVLIGRQGWPGPLAPGNLGNFSDFYLAGGRPGRSRGIPPPDLQVSPGRL